MSWVGWLLIVAMGCVAFLLLRGVIDFVLWGIASLLGDPDDEPGRSEGDRKELPSATDSSVVRKPAERDSHGSGRFSNKDRGAHRVPGEGSSVTPGRAVDVSSISPNPSRPPGRRSIVARSGAMLADFFKMLVPNKNYDQWIATALAEEDPERKLKYYTKALELNPEYAPGWGLKGRTLLDLQRYEAAKQCFDRLVAIDPNPISWYEKGMCCYQLRQYEDAIACFGKTLAGCSRSDRELSQEASEYKRLAEEALRQGAVS